MLCIMTYIMRSTDYRKLRSLAASGTEHSGFLIGSRQPAGYPFATDVLFVGAYLTGIGTGDMVKDYAGWIKTLDQFRERNRGNGFLPVQFHTHIVDETFSPDDLDMFDRTDHMLGWQPRYLFTPTQIFSARKLNGVRSFDYADDLPLIVDESHEAAGIIRRIKTLVQLELQLL